MNKQEVYKWLCQEKDLTIAFDTNALFGDKHIIDLCDNIARLKRYSSKYQKIHLVIPAPAHAEKLHDLKQKYQEYYDLNKILEGLKDKGIIVKAFEPRHADIVANLLGKQFPTTADWRTFKRNRCISCLGLKGKIEESLIPGTGKNCGATLDWLIAGYAYAEDCLLVTNDTGKEFQGIMKTTLTNLEAAIDQLLQEVLIYNIEI